MGTILSKTIRNSNSSNIFFNVLFTWTYQEDIYFQYYTILASVFEKLRCTGHKNGTQNTITYLYKHTAPRRVLYRGVCQLFLLAIETSFNGGFVNTKVGLEC